MFQGDILMGLFDKFKKKNNASRGQFERIEVGGKTLSVLNFYLFNNKDENKRYMELAALDELPELHYAEITMDVFLTTKKLTIKGAFAEAFKKGKFKVYKFEILEINEYYI